MRIICSLMAVLLMFGSLVSCQKPKYKDADKVELGNNTVKDAITTVKDVSEIKPVQGSTVDEEAVQIILNGSETAVGFDGAAFADNGNGMREEVITHIFEKFYQGDESHGSMGNGLGLSIAARIVDLCGGTITARSEVGRGSVFVVELPLNG